MAEIYLIKQDKALLPAADSDAEAISKLKNGGVYKADVVAPRNLRFHRKTFALLNLTYSFWEPDTLISQVEVETVEKLRQYMAFHGVSGEAIDSLCVGFIKHLEADRQNYPGDKCFNSFREWITVKSGFYNIVKTPSGLRKVAKSISFAQCDQVDFGNFYKALMNSCWALCLNRVYESQDELAKQLLEFE